MLNQCFNPNCRKPLHYLRDGRVFVFGMHDGVESANGDGSRLEHYWLCATCAQLYGLAQDESGIHLIKRRARPRTVELELPGPRAIAS